MRILLATAFALGAGLMMTRVFKWLHFKCPDVTAFLIAGVLVGPYALGGLGLPGFGFASTADFSEVSCPTSPWASSPLTSATSSVWPT